MRWSWLVVAVFLSGSSCATHTAKPLSDVHYIVVGDELPNDWRICVPLPLATEKHQMRCMRLWEFRLMLRHSTAAD